MVKDTVEWVHFDMGVSTEDYNVCVHAYQNAVRVHLAQNTWHVSISLLLQNI